MFNVIGKGITIKDPELKYTKNGSAVASCTAVNKEEYKGEETPHFTNLVLLGDVAEKFAKEITKGKVTLQGNMDPCMLYGGDDAIKRAVRKNKKCETETQTGGIVL